MKYPIIVGVLVCSMVVCGTTSVASADAILLNFGASAYSGTNDPAHVSGAVPAGETTWNMVAADTAAGSVEKSDGSTAAGVSIDIGRNDTATTGGAAVLWTKTPGYGTYSGGSGIFATALGRTRDSGAENQACGARVRGLAPGQYDIYAIVHWANDLDAVNFGIGVDSAGVIDEYNDAGMQTFAAGEDPIDTSWILNTNYWKAHVTVNSTSDYVVLITGDGVSGNGLIGMEIVSAVPEPCTLGLLALGSAALFLRRRRK
jgi:hypothetical protein